MRCVYGGTSQFPVDVQVVPDVDPSTPAQAGHCETRAGSSGA